MAKYEVNYKLVSKDTHNFYMEDSVYVEAQTIDEAKEEAFCKLQGIVFEHLSTIEIGTAKRVES